VTTREQMGDTFHLGLWQDLADELELGATCGAVLRRDREDGAVVLDDAEPAVG
jgi:hypothetical protein